MSIVALLILLPTTSHAGPPKVSPPPVDVIYPPMPGFPFEGWCLECAIGEMPNPGGGIVLRLDLENPPELSRASCGIAETAVCDRLPDTPETALACSIVGNYAALIRPACEATVESANNVIEFLWNQGYVRAGEPKVSQVCDAIAQTSPGLPRQEFGTCLTLAAQVLYSARSDSAVVLCQAYSDGATTVNMNCGGTPGIAVAPTSIAITPAIPGATGSVQVTAHASDPLPEALDFIANKQTELTVEW